MQDKKCSTGVCGCHKQTLFCNWHGGQDCLNPFITTKEIFKSSKEDTVKQITLADDFDDGLE